MLATLLKILAEDFPAPEILLEQDGDIGLDWGGQASISIRPSGKVAWAVLPPHHGTDLDEFLRLLRARFN